MLRRRRGGSAPSVQKTNAVFSGAEGALSGVSGGTLVVVCFFWYISFYLLVGISSWTAVQVCALGPHFLAKLLGFSIPTLRLPPHNGECPPTLPPPPDHTAAHLLSSPTRHTSTPHGTPAAAKQAAKQVWVHFCAGPHRSLSRASKANTVWCTPVSGGNSSPP